MASDMPLPVPPRTPTPPPDDDEHGHDTYSHLDEAPPSDSTKLFPTSDGFAASRRPNQGLPSPLRPDTLSTTGPTSPAYSSMSFDTDRNTPPIASAGASNPFNFQTQTYTAGKPASIRADIGRRKGHKYKHSSISHQIFLEPPPRPPLQLPTSLPIPTVKECWRSMSKEQKYRGLWCFCHLLVAVYVQASAHGSLALTALAHLLFYDATGAVICVAVDVGTNFEVWTRSSLRYPFGLERAEVLAGMAMSVMILFEGLDLVSHGLTHALENVGDHEAHHSHDEHERISPGSVDIAVLAAIVSTLVSAAVLKNHARIGKVMRFAYIESLPSVLSNPSHFLTLSCSAMLLLLPLLSLPMYIWLDRVLAFTIAAAMIFMGVRIAFLLGKMLLMSYSGTGVDNVIRAIEADPQVTAIEEAKFWQVHYGLCQANLKLRVRSLEEMNKLRDKITNLVKSRLGGGYGSGGQRWEVSTQLTLERD